MAVCILGLGVLAGCATGPKGPTDQELITQTVTQLKDALFAGDSEKLLACFSEDFSHYEVPDKQTLADYVQMGVDMGYIDQLEEQNAVMEFAEAEIKIEGDTATMYPIEASADAGSVTVELTLKKEADGVWRIVTADVEGI
ncbi:MAG: Nuclear transport factor 2 family protein [Candidatus Hydrogenedentes bacterium]|nr:Nuclear transport factor 2 family protein [Candidatus Hydrogenedentota bacterium]